MPSASERIATTVTNGVRNSVRSATLIFRMAYLGDGERSSSGHHASTVAQGGRFASITEQYFRGCTKNDGGESPWTSRRRATSAPLCGRGRSLSRVLDPAKG